MKFVIWIMTILMMCVSIVALSEDYENERNEIKHNEEEIIQINKKPLKKNVDRVKVYLCLKGDVKCEAKKLKQSIEEKKGLDEEEEEDENDEKFKIIK